MNISSKVKKTIRKDIENKIIRGELEIYNQDGERVEILPIDSKYKYKLSNEKRFMKKWIDRKVSKLITDNLRDVDLGFLYKIESYIDDDNVIDFKRFKIDYKYSDSKLSKSKKPLLDTGIIKEKESLLYLNPLVGIIGKEIKQELIDIFKEIFEKYKIDITYK